MTVVSHVMFNLITDITMFYDIFIHKIMLDQMKSFDPGTVESVMQNTYNKARATYGLNAVRRFTGRLGHGIHRVLKTAY